MHLHRHIFSHTTDSPFIFDVWSEEFILLIVTKFVELTINSILDRSVNCSQQQGQLENRQYFRLYFTDLADRIRINARTCDASCRKEAWADVLLAGLLAAREYGLQVPASDGKPKRRSKSSNRKTSATRADAVN
ncbi:hypothetical protein Y032_0098g3084 [Ancylostoma ceylanicum]|nr:hypothetical protein Y032_0098g3084 [Ancylostoma ceylanicum]